jgi:hypothetical protein
MKLDGSLKVSEKGGLGRIEMAGKVGAVLQRTEGIVAVLDMKNPARPKVVGRYDDQAKDSYDGDLAFTHDAKFLFYARQTKNFSKEGIHVLNVEEPSEPRLVSYAPAGGSFRIAYHYDGDAEWVILHDAITGLVIYRFERNSGQLIPVHVDALPALKVGGPASSGLYLDPEDPETGKPLLYATTGRTGLQIFDLSNPADPVEVGAWRDEVGLAEVVVDTSGKRRAVYVATEYWFKKPLVPEVFRLNADDLGDIKKVSSIGFDAPADDLWRVQGMALSGGRLHIAHSHLGLVMTTPAGGFRGVARIAAPSNLDPPFAAPFAMDVAVAKGKIYLSDAASGRLSILTP